jgi:hypothetical protein
MQTNIEFKGIPLEVHYDYQPEEKMVWTYPNGDPGHPGCAEEFNIYSVLTDSGDDLIYDLTDATLEEIEKIVRGER